MPSPQEIFANALQQAISNDNIDEIKKLHAQYPQFGLNDKQESLTRILSMSPLQYAVMYKHTLALSALLELGYQVSETNHSAMATLFGPITHIINCQEIYLSKTLKTILFHPTYQPTKDLAELKSILEKLHFNSVRDLYGGYVNLNAENNVKFTADILFTLKLLTSTSPINSFTDFYPAWGYSPLWLLRRMVFHRVPDRKLSDGDFYNEENDLYTRSSLVTFILTQGIVPDALKQKIEAAGPHTPLHLFAELIPMEKRFHWAKLIYKDPTPEISEIICTLLVSQSYLHNEDDRNLLKKCSASLTHLQGIKRSLKQYSDYVALDDPRVWMLLDQYLPLGLPKHIDSSSFDAIQLFKYAKAWMAGDLNPQELITIILYINFTENKQTLMELLLHLVLYPISHKKDDEKIKSATKLLKAFHTRMGDDIEWLANKISAYSSIQDSVLLKTIEGFFEGPASTLSSSLQPNSDLAKIFPLINYVFSNTHQTIIPGPKLQPSYRSRHQNAFQILFLQWLENYILLHLQDEFGFDDQLIVEVYPNFIAEKHDIENAQINKTLCLGRKDGLFYDPIVEPMPSDVTYPELHASYSYSELPQPIDGNSSALSTFLSNLHKQTDISFKDFQIFLDLLNHPSFQCSKRDVDHFVSVYHQSIADASTPKSSKYVTELYPSATSNKGPNHIQICLVFTFKMLISKGSFDFPPQFTSILQYFHDICFEPAIPSQTLLQQRAGLTAFLMSSGLIPSALAKKLYKNNAGNNIPLSAFSELIPLENKFRWIKLWFKDPTHELIELMKPIITSKSYLHNGNHRILLQNCCNNLRSFEKLMPILKDYSDYVILDHRAIWLELAKYFPSGMPAQLDVTDQDALQLFIKAKWWMAENGGYQNSSNHRNEICKTIRCLSAKTIKTAMELLVYLILHLRANHINSPETIARAHGCKEILESYTDALPELYWVMSKLYEANLIKGTSRFKSQKDYVNEKLELFERKTLSKGLVFENCFPLINYVLLKRKGPIAGVKQSIISSNLNHSIGLKFLIWLENFILLNLQGIFGINESVIKNIYPDALAQKEQLIEEQNKNILCLGKEDGLFYNPLPDLKFDPNVIVKQTPPTAPPMSIAPSRVSSPTRSRSASISEPEHDPHAIVADDLIAKLKAIPDQKDDDNDLEIDEPTVSEVQIANPVLITEPSSTVIVADAHPISSTEVVVDDEPVALPNFPQPSTDAPEDQYPKVADDELLAPKRIAVAVSCSASNNDHKPSGRQMPFFAPTIVHKEETPNDASNINLDAFKTTQEKLNYIKATFEQETTNLHYLTKVTGHDTNAITQKILITLNGLFAWKVRLENELAIETKQSATNSFQI